MYRFVKISVDFIELLQTLKYYDKLKRELGAKQPKDSEEAALFKEASETLEKLKEFCAIQDKKPERPKLRVGGARPPWPPANLDQIVTERPSISRKANQEWQSYLQALARGTPQVTPEEIEVLARNVVETAPEKLAEMIDAKIEKTERTALLKDFFLGALSEGYLSKCSFEQCVSLLDYYASLAQYLPQYASQYSQYPQRPIQTQYSQYAQSPLQYLQPPSQYSQYPQSPSDYSQYPQRPIQPLQYPQFQIFTGDPRIQYYNNFRQQLAYGRTVSSEEMNRLAKMAVTAMKSDRPMEKLGEMMETQLGKTEQTEFLKCFILPQMPLQHPDTGPRMAGHAILLLPYWPEHGDDFHAKLYIGGMEAYISTAKMKNAFLMPKAHA